MKLYNGTLSSIKTMAIGGVLLLLQYHRGCLGLANVASTSWRGKVGHEPHKLQNKSAVFHFYK